MAESISNQNPWWTQLVDIGANYYAGHQEDKQNENIRRDQVEFQQSIANPQIDYLKSVYPSYGAVNNMTAQTLILVL